MIIANFTNDQDAHVTGLDQYDYGQVLRIQGLNLPTAVEIQFGLEETGGTTTTRIGVTKDGVTDVPIPDSMLENGDTSLDYTIYVFIYITDDTSGKTVRRIKMQVKARSKPELLNKPEEKKLFQQAIEAVNRSAKEAESWAHGREDMPERATDNAKYYSDQASGSAEEVKKVEQSVKDMVATIGGIEQQVQDVKEFAGQAKTAAENALLSEQEAKKSEEASLQHRTGAETAENNAELAEQNAKKSEQAVEQAKQLVMQMGQQVLQDKNQVAEKVEAFNKVVTDARDAIETVKTDAVDAVETAGTEQTKKVTDEGTKQVKAVEDKGQEVLQSIPQDFTTQMKSKLDKQQGSENKGKALVVGEDGNVTVGEVQGGDGIPIINTMSGESPLVVLDSAERVNKGFELLGKSEQITTTGTQLFDVNKMNGLTKSGVTVSVKDGMITATGMATKDEWIQAYVSVEEYKKLFKPGEKIFIKSYKTTDCNYDFGLFGGHGNPILGTVTEGSSQPSGVLLPIIYPARDTDFYFFVSVKQGVTLKGSLQPMVYQTGNGTYEPYTEGKHSPSTDYPQEIKNVGKWNSETQKYEVDVKVTGKNLIDETSLKNFENYTKHGSTYYIYRIQGLINGVQYTLSRGDVGSGNKMIFGISVNGQSYDNSNFLVYDGLGSSYNRKSITWTQNNVDYADILFTYNANQSQTTAERLKELFDRIEYIQLEYGKNPTAHEVLKKSQSVMLTSDRPVTKWDKLVEQDGQIGWLYGSKTIVLNGNESEKWIKDAANGVYHLFGFEGVYKIYEVFCDKLKSWKGTTNNIIENHVLANANYLYVCLNGIDDVQMLKDFLNRNNLKVVYYSKSQDFVPLPQSEQDAIRSLATYYPTTVISVDGGEVDPDIEVTYIADTKNFILNREKVMQAQMLNIQNALISQKISGGIKVTDSSGLPVEEFLMSGKTEQVQTTGAQLFDISKISAVNVAVDKDVIIVKDYASNTRITAEQFLIMTGLKPGDTFSISYTFEGNITASTGGAIFLGVSKTLNIMNGGQTGNLKNTVTLPSDFGSEYGSLYFYGNNSGKICYVKNFIINKGNSAKPYEPYTDKKPSPSPEYEQSIEITPQGIIAVNFTDGVNHQTVELNCPREFTKWDRLQKIDGVWNWVFRTCRYVITGDEEFVAVGEEYTTGSSTNFYTNIVQNAERQANGFMERLQSVNAIWSKVNETGFCINATQLHMRLPNTLLGVSDTATREEKKTAYVNYLKAEYKKGTPYSLMYEQVVPEFIPLSQSEQDKLNALTMYAPNTEITNDGDCDMELTYTVDTKSYVDAKIAEVSTAVVQKGIENV